MTPLGAQTVGAVVVSHHLAVVRKVTTLPSAPAHHIGTVVFPQNPANRCANPYAPNVAVIRKGRIGLSYRKRGIPLGPTRVADR